MRSRDHQPFDEDALRKLAGDKAFARGRGYADHGHIALLSMNGLGVLAAAFGTSDYTVWLDRSAATISGNCSCPAYEDSGFCKHMVATALAVNGAGLQGDLPQDMIGQIAQSVAELDKIQLEKLVGEMATADWRTLRSLCFSLGIDWEDDFD
ncbi:MAG: hypothetical protein HC788_09160 [Sphingopyxis sp.]|nr:hypothetical protein [Sphingopyxis sp.]